MDPLKYHIYSDSGCTYMLYCVAILVNTRLQYSDNLKYQYTSEISLF